MFLAYFYSLTIAGYIKGNNELICMSMKRELALIPFLLPVAVIFVMVIIPGGTVKIEKTSKGIHAADTAWILTSTALVF